MPPWIRDGNGSRASNRLSAKPTLWQERSPGSRYPLLTICFSYDGLKREAGWARSACWRSESTSTSDTRGRQRSSHRQASLETEPKTQERIRRLAVVPLAKDKLNGKWVTPTPDLPPVAGAGKTDRLLACVLPLGIRLGLYPLRASLSITLYPCLHLRFIFPKTRQLPFQLDSFL